MNTDDVLQLILGVARVQNAIIEVLEDDIPTIRASIEPKLKDIGRVGQGGPRDLSEIVAEATVLIHSQPNTAPASLRSTLDRVVSEPSE